MNNVVPLFSIVIPVYKVEKYLDKCVSSVISQNFKDIEIILVDDGSPDRCPQICDDLSKKDDRIKVIHKPNGGLSDARNVGINESSGDYILFLDSDDFWEGDNCLDNLVQRAQLENPSDIILYGTYDTFENDTFRRRSRGDYDLVEVRKSKVHAIRSLFITGQFPGSAWVVAINRKFLLKNNLFFIKGIKSEDIDWLINVFFNVSSIDCVNDAFYMYLRGREGSITNSYNAKSIEDILVSIEKWKMVLKAELSENNKNLLSYLAYQYITTFIIYSQISSAEQNRIKYRLLEHKDLFEFTSGIKATLSRALVTNLGINLGSKIIFYSHILFNKFTMLKSLS